MRLPRKVSLPLVVVLTVVALWMALPSLGFRLVKITREPIELRQGEPEGPPSASTRGPLAASSDSAGLMPDAAPGDRPRNLVLVVADGFGFAHLSAARTVLHGLNGASVWDRLPITGWQRTHPATGLLTDSAAAATAMATGSPTHYGAIGVDVEGEALETLFEWASAQGYATGVVTDSYIWDATPAAFLTHSPERGNDNAESALRQLGQSSLDVLVGELEDVGEGEVPEWDESIDLLSARFEVHGPEETPEMLEALRTSPAPVATVFEEDQVTGPDSSPSLPELTAAVLDRMRGGDRPFVLLIESEEPDSASHRRDFDRLVEGLVALEATLELVLDAAEEDGDTLVVFTSDHETGGLALGITERSNMKLQAIWATEDHTGVVVPVMASGPGAEPFVGSHANWEVGRLLRASLDSSPAAP